MGVESLSKAEHRRPSAGRGTAKAAVILLCGALAACSSAKTAKRSQSEFALGVAASPRVVTSGRIPKGGGRYHVGKPYRVGGKTYVPREDPDYEAVGMASWYGPGFQGRRTANGEVFDMHALTAAHPTLPLPSYVRVTNLENRRSVMVRVNDRGPFGHGRVIDLSRQVARMLDFERRGKAKVHVEYVDLAAAEGDDTLYLLASYSGPSAGAGKVAVASLQPRTRPRSAPILATGFAREPDAAPAAEASEALFAPAAVSAEEAEPAHHRASYLAVPRIANPFAAIEGVVR